MSDAAGRRSRPEAYCALIALGLAAIAAVTVMSVKDYRPSALVRMGVLDQIAGLALVDDPAFALYQLDHYDGLYQYAIARDPFARGIEHHLIDLPGARYGHPLYAWTAGLLSLGQPLAIPVALFAINLIAMPAGAYATGVLSRQIGWTPWAGLAFALNPGFLFAVTVSTSEIFGSLLLILALLAWFRERWRLAAVAFVLLCLAKEPFVLVCVGLGVWHLFQVGWRNWRDRELLKKLGILALGPLAALAWQLYLLSVFGRWAFSDYGNTTIPFIGIGDAFAMAAFEGEVGFGNTSQIALASLPLLLTFIGACVAGVVVAIRSRTQIAAAFVGLASLNFLLTWHNLYFAKDLIRQFSTTLLLLPLVIAAAAVSRNREPAAPSPGP